MYNSYCYVNGIEGARQYQMMPNQTMLLMDSENPMFYLKTSNHMGQTTLRAFKFEEITIQEKYATAESVKELSTKIEELLKKYESDLSSK